MQSRKGDFKEYESQNSFLLINYTMNVNSRLISRSELKTGWFFRYTAQIVAKDVTDDDIHNQKLIIIFTQ